LKSPIDGKLYVYSKGADEAMFPLV